MFRSCFFILAGILCAGTSLGQATFKQGYFVDLQGNKTECYIKDNDWRGRPKAFNYKLTENGEIEKMDTDNISEFKTGTTKYIRAKVQYDQSSQELAKLSINSNPEWIDGNLLLKVIVEGKATLYHYNVKEYSLFFYSVAGSAIEQLVFKNYYTDPGRNQKLLEQKQYLHQNNTYLYQLNTKVNCGGNVGVTAREVPYQLNPLAEHFQRFNLCSGDAAIVAPKQGESFSLRLTPGIDFPVANANEVDVHKWSYEKNITFRTGLEFQFTLPFNNGKWAIVTEPTYASFSGNEVNQKGWLKFQLLEFPFGVRHRFFLSEKSNIFINGMALVDFPLNYKNYLARSVATTRTETASGGEYGFAAGAGFSYGRFSIEGRYYSQRTRDIGAIIYTYSKSTLILGFRVF